MRALVRIVDDEVNLRRLLRGEIASMGCLVAEASDAEEALAQQAAREADLILLDLRLPGRSGLEILGELRERWPRTEVIVMTGHGSVETAIQALKRGAYDYLQSPATSTSSSSSSPKRSRSAAWASARTRSSTLR